MLYNARLLKIISLALCFIIFLYTTAFAQEFVKMAPKDYERWYFDWPAGISTDSHGNIYVSDSGNHQVKKFDNKGNLLFTYGGMGSDKGQFINPGETALDKSDNLYVVDTGNDRIQKFDKNGKFIIAWGFRGTEIGRFQIPVGVDVYDGEDGSIFIYVADSGNNRICKYDGEGKFIKTFGNLGNGDGQFNNPRGLALDKLGNIYVADNNNHRVQKFDSEGQFVASWGSFGDEKGNFKYPVAITCDKGGNVYVAESGNHRVQKLNRDGVCIEILGEGKFGSVSAVDIDDFGVMFVTDTDCQGVWKLNQDGAIADLWGREGSREGQFRYPTSVTMDVYGYIYVADTANNRIQKLNPDGTFNKTWGREGNRSREFKGPQGIAVDGMGKVYVADTYNHCIQKFDSEGNFLKKWGVEGIGDRQFKFPVGIATDGLGNIYVADSGNNRILKFDGEGNQLDKWGNEDEGNKRFNCPKGVAIDKEGNIYVADSGNFRILKLNSLGNQVGVLEKKDDGILGPGIFKSIWGIAIGPSGYIYVTDCEAGSVHKIYPADSIITEKCELWDSFLVPTGIFVDKQENVFVVDKKTHSIEVMNSEIPSNPPLPTPLQTIVNSPSPIITSTPLPTGISASLSNNSNPAISASVSRVETPVVTASTVTPEPTYIIPTTPQYTPTPVIATQPESSIPGLVFSDIKNHWARDYILELLEKGIIKGYEDKTIRPDNFITRNEASIILINLIGQKPSKDKVCYFADKDIPMWAIGYVNTALSFGLIKGFDDNTFRGAGNLTRAQAAAMLYRLLKATGKTKTEENDLKTSEYLKKSNIERFTDYKNSHWGNGCISVFLLSNIMNGYNDNTLRPDKDITRAEFLTMAARLINLQWEVLLK